MKIIDPHLHLFDLTQGDYHWLKADNAPFWPDKAHINKNFFESDLKLNSSLELTGFVHIEAGFDNNEPWREIEWLQSVCQKSFRSVACIDITLSPQKFEHQLTKLLTFKSVVGCRYILDENAATLLLNTQVQENLTLLAQHQLSFDAQLALSDDESVRALIKLLKNIPELTVIIDHSGWPPANTNSTDYHHWLNNIKSLAHYRQCAIKCSGWEVTDRQYQQAWVINIIQDCFTFFGEKRIMLASNFPLCLFASDYSALWQSYYEHTGFSQQQLEAVLYKNAYNWYKF
ncbi:MAG: L-fuconolactonase [Alteromonadaceae bacterium]|jgi:L-fuconolactonase